MTRAFSALAASLALAGCVANPPAYRYGPGYGYVPPPPVQVQPFPPPVISSTPLPAPGAFLPDRPPPDPLASLPPPLAPPQAPPARDPPGLADYRIGLGDAFDAKAETLPMHEFEPIVRRVFAQPKQSLYKSAAPQPSPQPSPAGRGSLTGALS